MMTGPIDAEQDVSRGRIEHAEHVSFKHTAVTDLGGPLRRLQIIGSAAHHGYKCEGTEQFHASRRSKHRTMCCPSSAHANLPGPYANTSAVRHPPGGRPSTPPPRLPCARQPTASC